MNATAMWRMPQWLPMASNCHNRVIMDLSNMHSYTPSHAIFEPLYTFRTNFPLKKNLPFEILLFIKFSFFNIIYIFLYWKYFSEFFKVHIKGGHQLKCAHACMHVYVATHIFSLLDFKNSEKYFQNQKNKMKFKAGRCGRLFSKFVLNVYNDSLSCGRMHITQIHNYPIMAPQ